MLLELLEGMIVESHHYYCAIVALLPPGYNSELDEWRKLVGGTSNYLDRLEIHERAKLELDTLKAGFNDVHCYYIQVNRRPHSS